MLVIVARMSAAICGYGYYRRTPENGDSAGSSGELISVSPEPCWVTLASKESVTLAAG